MGCRSVARAVKHNPLGLGPQRDSNSGFCLKIVSRYLPPEVQQGFFESLIKGV